ncbi:nuclear GTPase SLIP-GC [Colletotrichum spaethianum]|uniref:Nuclear GTPase SLIP-GC n=1 Tax=Colletotrichum spaethianum TaxID=700344 RepID=A0AA37UN35_9PEZI|nr:nuclear GTPase SLIP-GC [Colletotrichum spaethianum]GKT47805.1 nuclear GTPase SLIP-GC [Colletotrichum spaethianum]
MTHGNVLRAVKGELDESFMPPSSQAQQPTTVATGAPMVFSYLDKMRRVKDPEIWEQFTQQILPLLDDLELVCEKICSSRKLQPALRDAASHWIRQIHDIREEAERRGKTLVGVLGNTGDGKSSTINAVLEEESLLPTNCMRACTAVATELSYNHDEDQENPYRAEVEFISRDEWVREVTILLKDLASDGGVATDDQDPNSDAARAKAKIQAVYPSMNFKVLMASTSAQLADHPNVRQLLGTTKTMKAPTAFEIREQVEPYVDSKNKDDDTAAHWPLVKAVRIFTKAPVLSNGVTIVDLPGHQDWDAARAAVASQYMKACSGIWIVAPINRAVDNKTAKDLMSNSIKRQLKLDGSYSALTIICSKTDDMTINSAMESLKGKLGKDTMEAWKDALACERCIKALEKELVVLRKCRGTTQGPNAGGEERPAKRARTTPLIEPLGVDKSQGIAEQGNKTMAGPSKFEEKQQELYDMKTKKRELMDDILSQCIQRRNELSRDAVRRHLAKSFKDLDRHDAAIAQSQAGREPRDYEDMSRQTPVFCTSSLVYQKMRGLSLSDDDSTPGYETEEDTEIPQLQAHAQKMTEELRITKHKEVLSGICQLLNSISIWAQDAADSAVTIDSATLTASLQIFKADLKADAENCIDQLHLEIQASLYDEMNSLSRIAASQAAATTKRWEKINANTLKATCCRGGVFRDHDFNEQLLDPLKSGISVTWENFFQFNISVVLDNFSVTAIQRLNSFHETIAKQLGDHQYEEVQASAQLDQQLKLHRDRVMRLTAQSRGDMGQAQKDANRAFDPAVVKVMAPVYQQCANENGKGMAKRMQAALQDHIRRNKVSMFRAAIMDVKYCLKEGTKQVDDNMTDHINTIIATMKNDYMLALAERQKSARRLESSFKKNMMEFLNSAETQFK